MRTFKGIIESSTPPSIHHIWIHNGEAKYFADGKWQTLNITSEIKTEEEKIDNMLEVIELKVGINEECKTHNLKNLKQGKFFASIEEGYGVGTWDHKYGGHIHIINKFGNNVHYNVSPNGIVIKELESPDLYYSYVHSGGTKTPQQFISELINLIG